MRWQSPDYEVQRPTVKLVAVDEIAANLPADHPTVTPEEREETLRRRYLAVNKRRNPTGQFDEAQASSGGGSSSGCAVSAAPVGATGLWLLGLVWLGCRVCRRYDCR